MLPNQGVQIPHFGPDTKYAVETSLGLPQSLQVNVKHFHKLSHDLLSVLMSTFQLLID